MKARLMTRQGPAGAVWDEGDELQASDPAALDVGKSFLRRSGGDPRQAVALLLEWSNGYVWAEPDDDGTKAWREELHPRDREGRFTNVANRVSGLNQTLSEARGLSAFEGSGPGSNWNRSTAWRQRQRVSKLRGSRRRTARLSQMSADERSRLELAERRIHRLLASTSEVDLSGTDAESAGHVAAAFEAVDEVMGGLGERELNVYVGSLTEGAVAAGDQDIVVLDERHFSRPDELRAAYQRSAEQGWHAPVSPGRETEAVTAHALAEHLYQRERSLDASTVDWREMVDFAISDRLRATGVHAGVRTPKDDPGFGHVVSYYRPEARDIVRREVSAYGVSDPAAAVGDSLVRELYGDSTLTSRAVVAGIRERADLRRQGRPLPGLSRAAPART